MVLTNGRHAEKSNCDGQTSVGEEPSQVGGALARAEGRGGHCEAGRGEAGREGAGPGPASTK